MSNIDDAADKVKDAGRPNGRGGEERDEQSR